LKRHAGANELLDERISILFILTISIHCPHLSFTTFDRLL
jgi:hypothetical protein